MIKTVKLKSPVIIFVLAASFIFIAVFALKIFFTFTVDKNTIRSLLTSFCKNSLGKAVMFDDVQVTSFGNIIADNFNLSTTGDFNDNISLVKAPRAVFRLDFFKLLKKELNIKCIDFIAAEISLRKSYGKTYSENFKEITNIPEGFKNQTQLDYNDITVNFEDTQLFYTEFFNERKIEFVLENISAVFKKKKNTVFYSLKGRSSVSGGGNLSASGSIFLKKDPRSSHRIKISGFALQSFNDYIAENGLNFTLLGKISSNFKIDTYGSSRTLQGNLRTHNLSVKDSAVEETHSFISDGNFEIDIDALNDSEKEITDIKNFSLSDKNINMRFTAKNLEKEKIFGLDFVLKELNLSKLSAYVAPLKGVTYGGQASFNCKLYIDANNDAVSNMNVLGYINNFVMSGAKIEPYKISDGRFNIEIKDRQLGLTSSFVLNDSDIAINLKSSINKFTPLKSASNLEIRSKKFAGGILKDFALLGISSLYNAVYEDEKKRYHDNVSFLTSPAASLIKNNNIKIDWRSGKITFGKAAIYGLALAASLTNGVAEVNNFKLNGYGGKYSFDFAGSLNRDYPYFKLHCGVADLNLDELSNELDETYSLGGIMSINCEYGTGIAKMSRILQNTTANISISLLHGQLKGLSVQRRLNEWLHQNGYTGINLNDTFVNSFDLNFTQNADTYFFRRLHLLSDSIDFSGYGEYNYQYGAFVPLNMTLRGKTGAYRGNTQIILTGDLMSPKLSFNRKGSEPLLLFGDVR